MNGRQPLIAGNWTMHKTVSATRILLDGLRAELQGVRGADVAVAPPFTSLPAAAARLQGSRIMLGAQNMHEREEGAFTGEISAVMLTDLGVDFVILGHSERRHIFGETDETVAYKGRTALVHDLVPYLGCGATQQQREADETVAVVSRKLSAALVGLRDVDGAELVIAYEPVWAIGTGLTASPEQAQEVHAAIRSMLCDWLGTETAERIRLLYGGSVKPSNAAGLMAQRDIDGALVGGASLDAGSFAGIVLAAASDAAV